MWKDGKWVPDEAPPQEAPPQEAPKGLDLLSSLSEVLTRLAKVEDDNAAMRAELSEAKEKMGVGVDNAHVNHVLDRFFKHDTPRADEPVPQMPRFDAFTGQPLN